MFEPDFLELLARQCGREVKAAERSNVAGLPCPMGTYRCMCAQPHCTISFPTYGRKMLPYEWRSHLQASHPEDCKALLNLVEDLENEALRLWDSQPEAKRVYVQASSPVPAAFPEEKANGVHGREPSHQAPETEGHQKGTRVQTSPPVPTGSPEQSAEGSPRDKPSDHTSGTEESQGGTKVQASSSIAAANPEQMAEDPSGSKQSAEVSGTEANAAGTNPIPQGVQHLLSQSLTCPFLCGKEHLVPGADYATHCLSHLAELQTLAAVLDTLVLRAYVRQICPFKNYAAQGEPGPCRLSCKGGDWWAHIHCTHLTDALATSMHLFRRGERTLEAATAAAARTWGAFQLHCPIPRCISHTPTAVKLVAHFVGHLRPLHPNNDTAHLFLTRAKDMGDAGRAGAAAAKQPFLTASGMGPKNGKQKFVHRGMPGKQEQHACYTVVRGSKEVKPFYRKHQALGQQHIDPQQQQQQQQQQHTLQQQQQQLSKTQPAPAKPQQAASGSPLPMYCPFPHCCTAPVAISGLEQPAHSIQLPAASSMEQQTCHFETPADLEAHAFSDHSAELLLAAHQFACIARTESRTGMLVCPVRSVAAPPGRRPRTAMPQSQSRPIAQGHLTHHHSARGSHRAGGSEQLQGGLCEELQGHQELHHHAKDLVQHLHAQHVPLAMVVAALSKGLVRVAAACRGQPEEERCPLCPPSPAAEPLHDEAPVFGHLLDQHPSHLLKVFHCLLVLASGRDLSSASAGQCLLQCGASRLGGGTLGAMLHAAEGHAHQVLELSAGAAAEAVPRDTKAAALCPRKGSLRKQAFGPIGPQLPARLLSHASGSAMKPPRSSPAEQLGSRDSGVQASRVPAQALAREHLLRSYGPPSKPPKQKVDAWTSLKPDMKSAEVTASSLSIPGATASVEVTARPWSIPGATTSAEVMTGPITLPSPDTASISAISALIPSVEQQHKVPQPLTSPPQQSVPQNSDQVSPVSQPEENRMHVCVGAPPIKVAQDASNPAPSAHVTPSPTAATEAETPTGVQAGAEQQTEATAAAAAAAQAPSKPFEHPSLSTSTSINVPQTPTGNIPSFAMDTLSATSPRASAAPPAQQPPRPLGSHPSFMHLAIENDPKVQQQPTEDDDHEELNSTLGSAPGGTPRGDQGLASLENTGSTIVMPSLKAVQEEGNLEGGTKPPAATAAGSEAAVPRTSSPQSKSDAKEESKQGKGDEEGLESKPPAPGAAAASEAAGQRASSPQSKSDAKEESKGGKEDEQGEESKPPAAAATAAAAKEKEPNKENKPSSSGKPHAGSKQGEPSVTTETQKEGSDDLEDISEEALENDPDV